MTQITLVLPSALPPPELATDVVRALQAPSLATLLTRSKAETLAVDDTLRALPHETWLARTLGLSPAGLPAFASTAMRGFGLDPAQTSWFIVNPAHIEIARSHLLLHDMRRLHLSEAHSRALFDTAKPYFDEAGKMLLYGDAQTWFMRADDWTDLETATPDAATGMNLTDWLPKGPHAREFRKLQNEVQMLWFEHPVNVERESRGLAAVNSFWPWGLASGSAAITGLATSDTLPWLEALARPRPAVAATVQNDPFTTALAGGGDDAVLICDSLSAAALGGDWATWLQQMQRLEENLFAPALAALTAGKTGRLALILSRPGAQTQYTTTKLAQYAFWRRPTLTRLLP